MGLQQLLFLPSARLQHAPDTDILSNSVNQHPNMHIPSLRHSGRISAVHNTHKYRVEMKYSSILPRVGVLFLKPMLLLHCV